MEDGNFNYHLFHVGCTKFSEHGFTNNKVLLSHFDPPKFNIALDMWDNAIVFGSYRFAVNGISTP